VFTAGLHVRQSDGTYADADPTLAPIADQADAWWAVDVPVPVTVAASADATTLTLHGPNGAVAVALPAPPTEPPRGGTVTLTVPLGAGAVPTTWRYTVTGRGAKLLVTVPQRVGQATVPLPVAAAFPDGTPIADADVATAVGRGLGLSVGAAVAPPEAWGADGRPYAVAAWAVDTLPSGGTALTLVYDDRAVPDDAFPLTVDPTITFDIPSSGDDGHVYGQSVNAWPPMTGTGASTTGANTVGVSGSWDGTNWTYTLYVGVFFWDTSSLASIDGYITDASIQLTIGNYSNAGILTFSGGYYSETNRPIGVDDYSATRERTAFDGVSGSVFSINTPTQISLTAPYDNINRTGYTGIRVWGLLGDTDPSGGSPGNSVRVAYFYSFDNNNNNSAYKPKLLVTYEPNPFVLSPRSTRGGAATAGTLVDVAPPGAAVSPTVSLTAVGAADVRAIAAVTPVPVAGSQLLGSWMYRGGNAGSVYSRGSSVWPIPSGSWSSVGSTDNQTSGIAPQLWRSSTDTSSQFRVCRLNGSPLNPSVRTAISGHLWFYVNSRQNLSPTLPWQARWVLKNSSDPLSFPTDERLPDVVGYDVAVSGVATVPLGSAIVTPLPRDLLYRYQGLSNPVWDVYLYCPGNPGADSAITNFSAYVTVAYANTPPRDITTTAAVAWSGIASPAVQGTVWVADAPSADVAADAVTALPQVVETAVVADAAVAAVPRFDVAAQAAATAPVRADVAADAAVARATQTWAVRVLDPGGRPMAGVPVRCAIALPPRVAPTGLYAAAPGVGDGVSVPTDAAGTAQLTLVHLAAFLPATPAWRVTVGTTWWTVRAVGGGTRSLTTGGAWAGSWATPPTCTVSGTVTDATGAPLANVDVAFIPRAPGGTGRLWTLATDDSLILPRPVVARTDASGRVQATLLRGSATVPARVRWDVRVGERKLGTIVVPDAPSADLTALLTRVDPTL
jgi:hypothetical protein